MSWEKSTSCNDSGCVEVYRKSSASADTGNCVEVAKGTEILVRDSKDKAGPVLHFTTAEWAAFLAGVKAGEFD